MLFYGINGTSRSDMIRLESKSCIRPVILWVEDGSVLLAPCPLIQIFKTAPTDDTLKYILHHQPQICQKVTFAVKY